MGYKERCIFINSKLTVFLALGRNLRRKYDEETDGSLFKIRKEKEKFTEKCPENSQERFDIGNIILPIYHIAVIRNKKLSKFEWYIECNVQ